jgi:RNA polymerase sigma-70 factor (ECF subfamily)
LGANEHGADRAADFVQHLTSAQRRLHAFIYSLVQRSADAEDVLQETNVVLWSKAVEFEAGTNFMAWACQVAYLQVLAYRKRQARASGPFDDALLAQLAEAAGRQLESFDRRHDALVDCLEKLAPAQRQLIVRRYQPNASVQSMAAEAGKSAKALSETLRRIRDALMRCVERTLALEDQL